MPDLQQIYLSILSDILERLKEHSISDEEAVRYISEASQSWWYWNYSDDGGADFLGYVQRYYPQFMPEVS